MKKHVFLSFLLILLMALTAGCATGERKYVPTDNNTGWTPTLLENELVGEDPIEGFNRTMFWITDATMCYIGMPLARFYGSIMPKPGIECIENVCLLCEFPARLFSSLGAAQWKGAGDESLRFLINATIGIAGLFDPAENWFHIHSTESDFGAMFSAWGMNPGCTLMLPFVPAVTARDTLGFLFDCAFDAKTYLPYTYLATFNRFIVRQQELETLTNNSADHYKTVRSMLSLYRASRNKYSIYRWKNNTDKRWLELCNEDETVKPYTLPPQPTIPEKFPGHKIMQPEFISVSPVVDTLRSIQTQARKSDNFWFMKHTLFCHDFIEKLDKHRIKHEDGTVYKYAFFPQKHEKKDAPAHRQKLALLIPGIGSAFDSDGSLALSEVFYDAGYDVVVIDNPFFFRYITDGPGQNALPGYVPDDAATIRCYFAEILDDLKKRELIFDVEKTVLAGWSLGGVYAAHLMQMENQKNILNIDKAILINPPPDLATATATIDKYLADSKRWNAMEMKEMIPDAVAKMMVFIGSHRPEISEDIPIDKLYLYHQTIEPKLPEGIAEYLTGVALRSNIRDVLATLHKQNPLPQIKNNSKWKNRNALYDELDIITFDAYQRDFMVPYLQKKGNNDDLDTLRKKSSMFVLEDFLKNTDRVVLLHNYNDPLISDSDRKWLAETFQDRGYWFNAGGHLGNWNLNRFRKTVLTSIGEPGDKLIQTQQEEMSLSLWSFIQKHAYFWTFFEK